MPASDSSAIASPAAHPPAVAAVPRAPGRRLPPPGLRAFSRELAVAALGALVYFLIRGAVVDRVAEAFARADHLVALERSLGIFWEGAIHEAALARGWVVDLANQVYFWGHMPVIVAVAVGLFWRRRAAYARTRDAFLVSAVIGLAMYFTLPVAPPRLLPDLGFVDTMALRMPAGYQAQEVGPFVNPYAALPSLHFGWALLLGWGLWSVRGRRGPLRWGLATLAVVIPAGQAWATLATANHWILDVVAGGLVALVAIGAVRLWERRASCGGGRQGAARAARRSQC